MTITGIFLILMWSLWAPEEIGKAIAKGVIAYRKLIKENDHD